MTDSAVNARPQEATASYVARAFAEELAKAGVESDADLAHPIQQFGSDFILMVGPHAPHDIGFCWCQPTAEWCPSGGAHQHVIHRDPSN